MRGSSAVSVSNAQHMQKNKVSLSSLEDHTTPNMLSSTYYSDKRRDGTIPPSQHRDDVSTDFEISELAHTSYQQPWSTAPFFRPIRDSGDGFQPMSSPTYPAHGWETEVNRASTRTKNSEGETPETSFEEIAATWIWLGGSNLQSPDSSHWVDLWQ